MLTSPDAHDHVPLSVPYNGRNADTDNWDCRHDASEKSREWFEV